MERGTGFIIKDTKDFQKNTILTLEDLVLDQDHYLKKEFLFLLTHNFPVSKIQFRIKIIRMMIKVI